MANSVESLIRHLVNGNGRDYHREYMQYKRRIQKAPESEIKKLDKEFSKLLNDLENLLNR